MKTGLLFLLGLFPLSAFGVDLAKVFVGEYQVTERYCESGDEICKNFKSVVLRFDKTIGNYIVEEHFNDGSVRELELWTGSNGGETAYFTGTYNLSAIWSADLSDQVISVDFYRSEVGGQIWYKFSQAYFENDKKITRRFKIN